MSDINVGVLSGWIKDGIDSTVGRNNCTTTQFMLRGKHGLIRCIALFEAGDRIKREFKPGDFLVVKGNIRHHKWQKANGEWAGSWEFLVKEINDEINLVVLTGGVKLEMKELPGKNGVTWGMFTLASGAQNSFGGIKGNPVDIQCWARKDSMKNFINKFFRTGAQPTIVGQLQVSASDKVARIFLKHVNIWFNKLREQLNTVEPLSDAEKRRSGVAGMNKF